MHYFQTSARNVIAVLRPVLRAEAFEEAAKVASKWQHMYFENENVHVSNITECIVADIRAIANREE